MQYAKGFPLVPLVSDSLSPPAYISHKHFSALAVLSFQTKITQREDTWIFMHRVRSCRLHQLDEIHREERITGITKTERLDLHYRCKPQVTRSAAIFLLQNKCRGKTPHCLNTRVFVY